MNGVSRPYSKIAGLLLAILAGGCATDSSVLQGASVMGSYFDTLPCKDLAEQYVSLSARGNELGALREKSGNPAINAIAYDSEYVQVRGKLAAIQDAAGRKGCELKLPEPAKPAADSPKAKKRRG